jgi:hypothetical protein
MTGLTYFKRYRMELDLRPALPAEPVLPAGYFFIPWDDGLLERHAEVKFAAFRDEMDTAVFPSLATAEGCRRLMEAIRYRAGFVAGACWLAARGTEYCGTIQGIRDHLGNGAIQNVGVVPHHRGRGLGTALIVQALHGFRAAGLRTAALEVTARNTEAIALYRRLGFRARRTVYKPALAAPDAVAEVIATA